MISSLISKIRAPVPVVEQSGQQNDEEKKTASDAAAPGNTYDQPVVSDSDSIDSDLQHGVQAAQATASVWPMSHLVLAYVLFVSCSYLQYSPEGFRSANRFVCCSIWVIGFVDTMQQGMSNALLPYVTSSFQEHSLTATTQLMSNLIGGIFKLPLAKILDIWGRPQGFALMMVFLTVGLIMMAGCNNVQTYAAAQVFYWIG